MISVILNRNLFKTRTTVIPLTLLFSDIAFSVPSERKFRPINDILLQILGNIAEIVAVTADADDQIFVLLGVLLCRKQCCTVKHIDRQLLSAVGKVGLRHHDKGFDALVRCKELFVKLHLRDKAGAGFGLVVAHH